MKKFLSILVLITATGLIQSCGWNWNKLNPTYIEPVLINNNEPVLHTLDDGRDLSGYPIPKDSKLNQYATSGTSHKTQTYPTKKVNSSIPVGTKTDKANEVISPFAPHRKLDTMGHPSGTIVKDPGNMQIFKLP